MAKRVQSTAVGHRKSNAGRPPVNGEPMVSHVNFRMEPMIAEAMQRYVKANQITRSEVIRAALVAFLKEREYLA